MVHFWHLLCVLLCRIVLFLKGFNSYHEKILHHWLNSVHPHKRKKRKNWNARCGLLHNSKQSVPSMVQESRVELQFRCRQTLYICNFHPFSSLVTLVKALNLSRYTFGFFVCLGGLDNSQGIVHCIVVGGRLTSPMAQIIPTPPTQHHPPCPEVPCTPLREKWHGKQHAASMSLKKNLFHFSEESGSDISKPLEGLLSCGDEGGFPSPQNVF